MTTDEIFAELAALKPRVLKLHQALKPDGTLEDLPGWVEFLHRPSGILRVDGLPVLVATLYGPSGAGKSTLFRQLTGVDVPAGSERRPTTYGTVVAVPAAVTEKLDLEETFPGYKDVLPLERPGQLADDKVPADRLYFAPYETPMDAKAVSLIADVPDINTTSEGNWVRAEHMMKRSEVVVFVSGPESYSDDRVLRHFNHSCAVAGSIAYLFTKCTRRQAEIKWDHLKELADGDLSRVAVYYSEFSKSPTLAGVRPLFTEERLPELLQGADALDIRMRAMEKHVKLAIESLEERAVAAKDLQADLTTKRTQLERAIDTEASRVAGSEFPIGRVLKLVVESGRKKRGDGLVDTLLKPVAGMAKGIRGAAGWMRDFVAKNVGVGRDAPLRERDALEREKLARASQNLVDVIRRTDRRRVTAADTDAALKRFAGVAPPPLGTDWEAAVRSAGDQWVDEHPDRVRWITAIDDILTSVGGAAICIDLAVSGGFVSTIGGAAVAGGVMMGGGRLVQFLDDRLGLRKVLETADLAWKVQREGEIARHLTKELVDPLLLREIDDTLSLLDQAEPEVCLQRATKLRKETRS